MLSLLSLTKLSANQLLHVFLSGQDEDDGYNIHHNISHWLIGQHRGIFFVSLVMNMMFFTTIFPSSPSLIVSFCIRTLDLII